jgi:hypothetical protein
MTVISRGQPSIWDSAIGTKHIVYEAFCADGTCLPPVIFTSSEKVISTQCHLFNPGPIDRPAFVVYMPNLGAPSTASTVVWLDKMTSEGVDYFEDQPHVILDSLRGHFATDAKVSWKDNEATLYRLPSASGKWLNPCDQAINREMRRTFLKLQRLDRKKKLEDIIYAYYSISPDVISHSFNRCGLFGGDPEDIITEQASQGFHPTLDRKETVIEYKKAFSTFLASSVRSSRDVLPRSCKTVSMDSSFDGDYWTSYGSPLQKKPRGTE